ncbi:unnamed protein product [Urochloa humidicola]
MADHGGGGGARTNLKWTPHMSNIMLRHLVEVIETGVRAEKGFKEVYLNSAAKQVTEATGVVVSGTQVYNHLLKWHVRWVKIGKMKDLSAALFDETTNTISLDDDHYKGHIKDHPADAEYLNVPLENYDQMAAIFSTGVATGRFAMGSSEALGTPLDVVDSDGKADPIPNVINGGYTLAEDVGDETDAEGTNINTPPSTWIPPNASESGTGVAQDKGKDSAGASGSKRKRAIFAEEEVIIFNGMTDAVNKMADAVKETVHAEAHPGVYQAVMTLPGFTEDALLDALSWLYNNKAESIGFVQMIGDHRCKWMNRWLAKHYFNT